MLANIHTPLLAIYLEGQTSNFMIVGTCIRMYEGMYICVCKWYMCVCMFVCMCLCMCVYITLIYKHVYTLIPTYIHICTYVLTF